MALSRNEIERELRIDTANKCERSSSDAIKTSFEDQISISCSGLVVEIKILDELMEFSFNGFCTTTVRGLRAVVFFAVVDN